MFLLDAFTRFGIAKETGLIISIISLILAVVGLLVSFGDKRQNKIKKPIISLCVIVSLVSGLLLRNYYTVFYIERHKTVNVPNVVGLSYSEAKFAIRLWGLSEDSFAVDGGVVSPEQTVQEQDPSAFTEVFMGSKIMLTVESEGTEQNKPDPTPSTPNPTPSEPNPTPSTPDPTPSNPKPTPSKPDTTPSKPATIPSTENLTITIDYIQETESYHYEYPNPQNPNSFFLIDLGKGMSGTFSYSRPLNAEEQENWYHGGKLYDQYGDEVGQEDNWPSFWSNSEGKFAFAFPQNLPAGQYTYVLYQSICGQYISDTVDFTVK